jgi:hypothetical protein
MKRCLTKAVLVSAGLLLGPAAALAVVIPSSLSITGTVGLDTVNSANAVGAAVQSGVLTHRSGGVASHASFAGNPAGLAPSALAGALLQTGDGIGVDFALSGAVAGAANSVGLFADYSFHLLNSSAVQTYTVVFRGAFVNAVAATGSDAFAQSTISVRDSANTEVLFSDYRVDTFYTGPGNNFTANSPSSTYTVVLAPGAQTSFSALQTMKGGVYSAGDFSAGLRAFVSVDQISPVPEPASAALLGVGLAVLLVALKRRAV